MKTIGIGIIGCGKIAQIRHIPEYIDNPQAKLVGFYDINHDRAKEIADKFGGTAFSTVEELLKCKDIDAVSVLTSNDTHCEISIAAMNAGKDALCEKPMAVTLEECEAMVECAKKTGKQLMIGQNQRYAKAHVVAKKLIESGEIGNVLTFRTTFGHAGPETWSIDGKSSWFFDKKRAFFGAMADLGIHKTDLIQFLIGQTITEVYSKITTLDKKDEEGKLVSVDDNAIALYTMDGGAIGTMAASWTYYGEEDNSTIIYGSKGVLKIYHTPEFSISLEKANGERVYYDLEPIQTNDNQTKSGVIDDFVNAIVNNIGVPIPGSDILKSMRAVFACEESSNEGRSVKVNQ